MMLTGNATQGPPPAPEIPWEIRIVDNGVMQEILCAICLQVLQKPTQCRNGHLFCQSCINAYIKTSISQCPQCRCPLKEGDLSRCLFAENHINNLLVFCKNHFQFSEEKKEWEVDEQGCQTQTKLEKVEAHEQECGFAMTICQYHPKCNKQIRKMNKTEHEQSCLFKPSECLHCHKAVDFKNMNKHIEECPERPLQCPKCKLAMAQKDLMNHKKSICPDEIIKCSYFNIGCEAKIMRKDLANHLSNEAGYHLQILKESYDSKLLEMKQSFDLHLKVRDEKIRLLEKSLSENGAKVTWKVTNWSSKKTRFIQSEKFPFGEFYWFLGFYTHGETDDCRDYISVYLFMDLGTGPKNKSITLEFTLKFLNHKDSNLSVKKEFKTTFPVKGGQGWGDRKAILYSSISEESGFLKSDCLYLEAFLSQKKTFWQLST